MTRYARKPALVAIGVTALLGLGLLAATGQFRKTDLAQDTLEELEKKIVGSTEGRIWAAYGDKLHEKGLLENAVKAYQRAVELQPDLADARLKQGLALGQYSKDAFFNYVGRLAISYPKLAVNLMARPELAALHADPRWEPMAAAAMAQAVD